MLPFRPGKGFFLHALSTLLPRTLVAATVLWAGLLGVAAFGSPSSPQRIISMSPSITEALFSLGVGQRVVGVTDYCQWPPEACTRTHVGGLLNPNLETWIALRPDLIILQETSERLLKHARNLSIPTLVVEMSRIETIFGAFRTICRRLGCEPAAESLIQTMQGEIQTISNRLRGVRPKKVLLLLGDSSDPARDMYAVGPATFLGELIELAGGTNLLVDPVAQYPRLSKEFVLHAAPEVIIEAGPKANYTPEQAAERRAQWQRFASIPAVQTGQIHFIGSDYILIPGPRLTLTLKAFARAIHPEVFQEVTAP